MNHPGDSARHDPVTLVRPGEPSGGDASPSSGLPPDLLGQAAERLRVLALLYATIFLLANVLPSLLLPAERARFLGDITQWGPSVVGISSALVVAVAVRHWRLTPIAALNVGPFFEVVSSYAIAAAELPPIHNDPFDRLLIAQARALRVPIRTADPQIARYDVETIW